MKKVQLSTRTIAFTAVMTALVAVATMALKIQTGESYTNLGDAMIFLTALFFGPVPALIAGGIGSFFADLITYPTTMWFTLVIKGLEGLIAGLFVLLANKVIKGTDKKSKAVKIVIYVVGLIVAALWMVGGYYVAKAFMYGTMEGALISLPKNFIQGGLSIVIAMIFYPLLSPTIKKMQNRNKKNKDEKIIEEQEENLEETKQEDIDFKDDDSSLE